MSATIPPIEVTIHTCSPGTGQCDIVGGVGPLTMESASVAFSWAHLNLSRVMRRLVPGVVGGLPEGIVDSETDLQVSLGSISVAKDGSSGGLAIALAIMDYYLGQYGIMAHAGCGATGEIDLRGRVLPVTDLVQKVEQAYRGGCLVVVAPFTEARELLEDAETGGGLLRSQALREFVLTSLKPVRTIIEAMEYAFEGKGQKPPYGLSRWVSEQPFFE